MFEKLRYVMVLGVGAQPATNRPSPYAVNVFIPMFPFFTCVVAPTFIGALTFEFGGEAGGEVHAWVVVAIKNTLTTRPAAKERVRMSPF